MLFDDNIEVFQGVWTDWENGGAKILTASPRNSQLLASFLSLFITFTGTRLWHLVAFCLHQFRDDNGSKDGLHHQRQVILRNSANATGTVWPLIQQAWAWRGLARKNLQRSSAWIFLVLGYAISSGVIAVFTASEIALNGETRRLIRPPSDRGAFDSSNCGFLTTRDAYNNDEDALLVRLYDTNQAAMYARECYNGTSRGIEVNCKLFTQPSIPWKSRTNAPCPFGAEVCRPNVSAFEADTGLINARSYFGINGPDSDILQYRKLVTCTPLAVDDRYVTTIRGPSPTCFLGKPLSSYTHTDLKSSDTLFSYHYGRYGPEMEAENNVTAQQIRRDFNLGFNKTTVPAVRMMGDGVPYHVETRYSIASRGSDRGWNPIKELSRPDADLSLILVAPNDMHSFDDIDDPVFAAHAKGSIWPVGSGGTRFDNPLSPIGCTTQFQMCNPVNTRCTNLSSIIDLFPVHPKSPIDYDLDVPAEWAIALDLNKRQRSVAMRLFRASSILDDAVQGRGQMALLASQFAFGTYQTPLSKNHWHNEVSSWFNTTLALEQLRMQEFAIPRRERYMTAAHKQMRELPPGTAWMCKTQMTSISNGTVNFRHRGLLAVLVVGSVIILLSFVHEDTVWWVRRRLQLGTNHLHSRHLWIHDGLLQLQRMALQRSSNGSWSSKEEYVPVTAKGELFHRYGDSDLETPLITTQADNR
ncbi:hypothetical protein BKA56DRAFT_716781 [Ilyonectria sp. MPI-CAGE-AT-0026]|nr:hypothetical protein BKA56DRAFT_716781 [Ilyonectria sp. MPI-CAGE-AT-0026]